jgi:hypothetical protein
MCDPHRVALTFPTLEFSMCKRIPPEGCRSAGPEGFEPPSTTVLETGALPIELRPNAFSFPANKKPPARALCPGGGVGLRPSVGYMTGTVTLVVASINWHGAHCFPRSMLGDQVFNEAPC